MLANSPYLPRLAVLALIIAAQSSCSPLVDKRTSAPSQLDAAVRSAERLPIDRETARQSAAIHQYLVGQLAFQKKELQEAIGAFSKASDLLDPPSPLLLGRLAELHVRAGDLNSALREVNRAIESGGATKHDLLLKAGILDAMNRLPEAEAVYQELREKHPEILDSHVLLASIYFKTDRPEQGIALLEEVAKRHPKDSFIRHYLGRAYERAGRLSDARSELQATRELEPRHTGLALDFVRVLIKQRDFESAALVSEEILRREPQNEIARGIFMNLTEGGDASRNPLLRTNKEELPYDTRFRIATLQIRNQNFPEAVRELNLVLAQDPSHDEARYNLASVLASTGHIEEALRELRRITKDQRLFVKSRTFAAFLLRQEKRYVEAEAAVREALTVESDDDQILSFLVIILREAKEFDRAKAVIERQLERAPEDEKLLFSYASLLHDMGAEAAAAQAMEKVVALNPNNSDALNYIAFDLAERGEELSRALELINRALVVRPNDGYYLDTLGWIYFKLGQTGDAEEVLARAVSVTSDDPEITEHYADVLSHSGKKSQAREYYQRALEVLRDGKSDKEVNAEAVKRIEEKLAALPE